MWQDFKNKIDHEILEVRFWRILNMESFKGFLEMFRKANRTKFGDFSDINVMLLFKKKL